MTHLTIQQLVAHTDGELSGPSLKLVEKHIGECEACGRELERLAEQDRLLISIISIDPGEAFFESLAGSVEEEISGRKKSATPAPAPPTGPRPAPAPVAERPERPVATPPPAPRPAPAPAAPRAELRLEPRPAPATVAPPVAPRPEPAVASGPRAPKPPRALSSLLIGVGAFVAGLAVAILVVLRLAGVEISFEPHVVSRHAPAGGGSPGGQQATPAPPPAQTPAAVVDTATRAEVPPPELAPAAAPPAPARRPRHPATRATDGSGSAAPAPTSTVVVPVQVIHTETATAPPAAEPAPEAPPAGAESELGILCGVVRDSDGHPVARAQVMMADVGVIALTDRTGRFCLAAPVGDRTLSVMALGFTPSRRLVSLSKRTPELAITLKTAAPYPTPR